MIIFILHSVRYSSSRRVVYGAQGKFVGSVLNVIEYIELLTSLECLPTFS